MKSEKAPRGRFAAVRSFRLALLGALLGVAISGTSAQAGSFFNDGTKHGVIRQSPVIRFVYIPDQGKFQWLAPVDKQPGDYVNRMVVSLADQRLYVYHDQLLLAWSTVSSGCAGHETPIGSYTVSQKDVDHHSNLYDNAPMPFFLRLTDDGLGLHAGYNPGYPASHGCLRLPPDLARDLYQHVEAGTQVEITSSTPSALSSSEKPASATSSL